MHWRKIVFAAVVLLNLALLAGLVAGDNGLFSYLALRERYHLLADQLDQADRDSRELSREIRLLTSDPAYQELVVREEFNYLRKDEVLYLFPQGADADKGDGHE